MIQNAKNRLVEYLATACTSTGQATFYNTREEQAAALTELHTAVLAEDRRAYALTAALPINDRNRQEVVYNLIATGRDAADRDLENRVIEYVARELPLNRALNLLVRLCRAKVNNGRMRRVCRAFWLEHGDAYRAIKYRTKFRTLLRHCHIGEGADAARAEIHRWIFGRLRKANEVVNHEMLRARLQASKNLEACYQLPLEIGRDIAAACHGVAAKEFTTKFVGKDGECAKGRATRKQSLMAHAQAQTDVDFERFSLIELLQHAYRKQGAHESDGAVDVQSRQRLLDALEAKATTLARNVTLPENVHVIVDNSGSARGSNERAFHALAVIEATTRVFRAVENTNVTCHYVGDSEVGDLRSEMLRPSGGTELRVPLARALADGPGLIVILSDGYENVAAGSVAQIMTLPVVKESGIAVVHLNPVAAVETHGVRTLAKDLPTFGLTDPAQLSLALLLGQATEDPGRLAPLFDRIENALKGDQNELARIV